MYKSFFLFAMGSERDELCGKNPKYENKDILILQIQDLKEACSSCFEVIYKEDYDDAGSMIMPEIG